jgi:paraquat-inducible protein B
MSRKASFFGIGLFVVAAFVIAVGTFIVFGSGSFHRSTAILVGTFKGSTNGLRAGAKVKAYGVEVGQVKRIMLHRVEETDEVVIPVLMEIDLNQVGNLLGARSLPDFDELACLQALERDAVATLQLESFVTGLLYVEMVFGVDQEGYVLDSDRFAEYRSVPTIPTEMQMMIQSLQAIASNLARTDFDGLVRETRNTVVDIQARLAELDFPGLQANLNALLDETRLLVNQPQITRAIEQLAEVMEALNGVSQSLSRHADGAFAQLNRTLGELEAAAGSANAWLDPSSAVYRQLVDALDQVNDAARSLRVFVDYLERNPNALITGKPAPEPSR